MKSILHQYCYLYTYICRGESLFLPDRKNSVRYEPFFRLVDPTSMLGRKKTQALEKSRTGKANVPEEPAERLLFMCRIPHVLSEENPGKTKNHAKSHNTQEGCIVVSEKNLQRHICRHHYKQYEAIEKKIKDFGLDPRQVVMAELELALAKEEEIKKAQNPPRLVKQTKIGISLSNSSEVGFWLLLL